MKSELVINAEKAAREACEGLGYTLQQIQDFIDMHIEGEMRRDVEKAKELASAKRSNELNKALVGITMSQTQKILCRDVIDDYILRNPPETFDNEPPVISRGYDAEDEESASLDSRDRARECNRG